MTKEKIKLIKDCKKEHVKAVKRGDDYDVEYWDGKVQAFKDVLLII